MKYLRIDGSNNNLNFTPYETGNEEKQPKRLNLVKKISYILGISVVLVTGGAFFIKGYFSGPVTNEEIFNKYFKKYEVCSVQNSKYITAMEFYRQGDYKKAAELFNEISVKEALPNQYKFYLSLSYSQLCMNNEAIEILEGLANNQDEYYYASNWYLGLSYLRGFHYKKAQGQLEKVVEDKYSPYRKDALQVINLLKKSFD